VQEHREELELAQKTRDEQQKEAKVRIQSLPVPAETETARFSLVVIF